MSIDVERVMTWDEFKGGGDWLGAARSWVQMKKLNGSRVTWGSREALEPPMSIGELEDVVAQAAWIAYQMGRRDGKKEAADPGSAKS